MRWLVVGFLLLAGCEPDHVEVSCTGSVASMPCALAHTKGDHTVKACFTVQLRCANGATATASACETGIAPHSQAQHTLSTPDFQVVGDCDRVVSSSITDLKLTKAE